MNQARPLTDQTLEPPGTIAVIGAGPLGIEAALYGRFLGYNVTLIEADAVGNAWQHRRDQPLPMLPDRCLSPLALSALNAQNPDAPPLVLPTTIQQWIDEVMVPLTQTDLLRGRVKFPARAIGVEHLQIQPDEDDDDDEELPPPDFRITVADQSAVDAEAVVVAIGDADDIPTDFMTPCPYFFRIAPEESDDVERALLLGFKQIVDTYAQLADRKTLDLYQPIRGDRVGGE